MIRIFASAGLCLAIVFQSSLATSKPAAAATCQVAGGQSGRLKYSGQLSKVSATVCGNQIWKLLGKPTKPHKPVKNYQPRKYNHDFTVTPDRPTIGSLPNGVALNQDVSLTGIAVRHVRNRMLLWYPSQVKFKPISFSWNFGDGSTAEGGGVSHRWVKAGNYSVRLVVGYSVRYRILGKSTWVALPGQVYAGSTPKTITVSQGGVLNDQSVTLVHFNCGQKPTAIGC